MKKANGAKPDIKPDPKNYRLHSDRNKALIKKSLKELQAGRSILLDSNDVIVAGNGVYEAAKELGIPIKVIESDGKTLIAVKRTDLKPDSKKRKQLALADNSTSDSSEFDFELLQTEFDAVELTEWGIELEDEYNPVNKDKEVDESLETKTECPQCGYKW